jgi:hypothetical protein
LVKNPKAGEINLQAAFAGPDFLKAMVIEPVRGDTAFGLLPRTLMYLWQILTAMLADR